MPPRTNKAEGGGQWVKKAEGPADGDGAPAAKSEGGEKPKGRAAGKRGGGKGKGKQAKSNPDVDEKESPEDGNTGPNMTLDKDAANRMILHYSGIPREKLDEAVAANAAERAERAAEEDEDGPLSGSTLLGLLKANPPKVTRYTKGELLSIRQLPASKVRPNVLDKLVDKENSSSPLLLRNQGQTGEDGEDGETGSRPKRERRSRKKDAEQSQSQAEPADSGDEAPETANLGYKMVPRNGATPSVGAAPAKAASQGANAKPEPLLSDMLFMDEDADVSETSRAFGKWFGEKAGAQQNAPASAKGPALQKSIAAALASAATGQQPPPPAKGRGTQMSTQASQQAAVAAAAAAGLLPFGAHPGSPQGGGAAGFPPGHPQAAVPGFNPYNAAYAQAYAQAMMAQGYGRGMPPGAGAPFPGAGMPFPGYPYGHFGPMAFPPGSPAAAAAAAAAAGGAPAMRPPGQNRPQQGPSTAKADKASQKQKKGKAAQPQAPAGSYSNLGASLQGGGGTGAVPAGSPGAMSFSQAYPGLPAGPPPAGLNPTSHNAEDSDDEAGCAQQ